MKLKNWQLFLIYFITALAFYWPTFHAHFFSDFHSWIDTYDEFGWKGLVNSFGDPAMHHVGHSITFLWYKLFGLNSLPWHLLQLILHTINAWLLFKLASELLFQARTFSWPAAACGAIFLLFPYQTEAVVWSATIHYLIATITVLGSSIIWIQYLKKPNAKLLLGLFSTFLLGIFSLETALVIPGILYMLFWVVKLKERELGVDHLQVWLRLILPCAVILGGYLLLNKVQFGAAVGHYGAEKHLNFEPIKILGAYVQYVLKFCVFWRYLPIDGLHKALTFIAQPVFMWSAGVVMCFSLIMRVYFYLKTHRAAFLIHLLLAVLFVTSMLTVLNMELTSMKNIASDRYGYLGSTFFILLIVYTFFQLNKFWFVPTGLYLILSSFLLIQTNLLHRESAVIGNGLVDSFEQLYPEFQDLGGRIFLLNLPDNFQGVYLWRNGFAQAVNKRVGERLNDRIEIVAWYNMKRPGDGAELTRAEENVEVKLSQWGCWWWYRGKAASDYSTTSHSTDFSKDKQKYTLQIQGLNSADVALLQRGAKLELVKFD